MSWNYRIVRRQYETGQVVFAIHEAHYNSKGEVHSITVDPVAPSGETLGDLKWQLEKMLDDAKNRPVFDYEGPFGEADPPEEDCGC